MEPTAGNSINKGCTDCISGDCVSWPFWSTAISCLNLCKDASIADVVLAEGSQLCNLITQLNALSTTVNGITVSPVIDFSKLQWGCVYPRNSVTYQCNCFGFPVFIADTSAPNGIGYCSSTSMTIDPTCAPVSIVTPNPQPTTILGVLQIMIDFMKNLCCDPCKQNINPAGP